MTAPFSLLDAARAFEADLVALRRDLHRHPELAYRETRTAGVVAERLGEEGWEIRTGVGGTGVVAERGPGGGPVVALRADMDALPIQEEAEHDYASRVPGVMHACGHDAHVVGLLGAARLLAGEDEAGRLPPGRVRLLFQPAEETVDEEGRSGATRLVDEGALSGVAAVFGLHVGAGLPSGRVFLRPGPVMAGSEEVVVQVRGRSAHAARPEHGVDALLLAARALTEIHQAVSGLRPDPSRGEAAAGARAPAETGIVSFGRLEGGTAPNVVADRARLHGTLRYFTEEMRARLRGAVEDAFAPAGDAEGESVVRFLPGYPPVVNDGAVTERVRAAAEALLGEDAVWEIEPMLLAEDFSILAREAPGCFVWLGAALPEPREHHHPRFDVDESVLPVAAALLASVALRLLEDPP